MRRIVAYSAVLYAALGAAGCGSGLYARADVPFEGGAAPDDAAYRLLLVGDIGDARITRPEGRPLLERLSRDLGSNVPAAVVLLGDNVYPAGVPASSGTPGRRAAERIVRAVVDATSGADDVVFVPGNHDWNDSRPGGLARIEAQGDLIARYAGPAGPARLLPRGGCPGPITVDLGSVARLVIIDTEWLLMPDDPRRKPLGREAGCAYGPPDAPQAFPAAGLTRETFYDALRSTVRRPTERTLVLVSHHPLRSRGAHGGYLGGSWLPLVWPALRRLAPPRQDFASSANRDMRARLEAILLGAVAPTVVSAAGHDHNLQVFEQSRGVYFLVSGAGSKTGPAGRGPGLLFRHAALGYMRLDFEADGDAHLTVVEAAVGRPSFRMALDRRP